MKCKRAPFIVLIVLGIGAFFCFSISVFSARHDPPSSIPVPAYNVCVFETRQNAPNSRMILFDEDLNAVRTVPVPYATLGVDFQLPVVEGNKAYVIPQGMMGVKDERKVLSFDLNTMESHVIKADQTALYGLSVGDGAVYTCSNLNFSSYIGKTDEKTGAYSETCLNGVILDSIIYAEGRLYGFGGGHERVAPRSCIYVFDSSLNLLDQIDISDCGAAQYRPRYHAGKVYFSSWTDVSGESLGSNILGVLDCSTGKVDVKDLGTDVYDILFCEDKLMVFYGEAPLIRDGRTEIAVLDNQNLEELDRFAFDEGIMHAGYSGGSLYALSGDTLYKLRIDDETGGVLMVKSVVIGKMGGGYSYLSGMITRDRQ